MVSEMLHGPSQVPGCREEEEPHTSRCHFYLSHRYELSEYPRFNPVPHTSLCSSPCCSGAVLGLAPPPKLCPPLPKLYMLRAA